MAARQEPEAGRDSHTVGPNGEEAAAPDVGHGMRERARELGGRLDALGARGFERVASVLEQAGDMVEERGKDTAGVDAVVEPLRRAGRYVGEKTPSSALTDLDRAIERHPYRALAVGLSVGWAIGRLTRRLRAG